jgi:hypothetical protein
MLYLCSCRSCSVTVGVTSGRNSRVCGDVGEVPMAGLCGSWALGSQEEAGTVVGLASGLFADVVEVASERWWAQW